MENKHGMKKLTLANWLDPDDVSRMYHVLSEEGTRPMNASDWANLFMNIELSSTVPVEVQRLFETARAALCYGWFYHSLFTFGMEQVCRVGRRIQIAPHDTSVGFGPIPRYRGLTSNVSSPKMFLLLIKRSRSGFCTIKGP